MKTELMRQLLSKDEKITIEFKECWNGIQQQRQVRHYLKESRKFMI